MRKAFIIGSALVLITDIFVCWNPEIPSRSSPVVCMCILLVLALGFCDLGLQRQNIRYPSSLLGSTLLSITERRVILVPYLCP